MKLTANKSFRVVEHLLEHPETSQLELSKKTEVALGHVNKIINYLHDLNIVSKRPRGCVLIDPVRLLEKISFERPIKRLESTTLRLPTTSIDETEAVLNDTCQKYDMDYALTSFSGLRRYYEYHISYPHIHVYTSDPELETKMERGEGTIPVTLLNPDRPEILANSKEIDGLRACDRVQIVVDLFSSGYGRDAAVKFLEVIQNGALENTG